MSVDDADGPDDRHVDGSTALGRIADVLGVPVEALTSDDREPLQVKGVSELLGLWVDIEDDADRERLLDFARQLAKSG